MTIDQIETFLKNNDPGSRILVDFNSRKTITGIFIETTDYAELKSKNLWRIVSDSNVEEYVRSRDKNLSRIFSGMEIMELVIPDQQPAR
jgi:hypothetical protein